MNKKKVKKVANYIVITAVLVLGISLFFFVKKDKKQVKHQNLSTKIISFENLTDMENQSPIIVKGIRVGESEPRIEYYRNSVCDAFTYSDFKITKVIKAEENQDIIMEDAMIKVQEESAYDKKTNTMYHTCGYELMNEGEEYLLFLRPSPPDHSYLIRGVIYGKVAMNQKNKGSEFATENIPSKIIEIIDEAREKYKN